MMKRTIAFAAVAGLIGLGAIQLIPYGRDHANPPVFMVAEPKWDSPATRATAVSACYDCHSNQTQWPWYSNIAPMSWLIQHDVDEGRARLNFSTWGSSSGGERENPVEAVREGGMPPFIYTLTHPNANFTDTQRTAFIDGLTATFGGGGD
jgi:hypothetical protein